MNKHDQIPTFEEWLLLQPPSSRSRLTPQSQREWYEQELADGRLNPQSYLGYDKFEALEYAGDELFFISSVYEGDGCADFFIVAVNPTYRVAAYNWYRETEVERLFRRLGCDIFDALKQRAGAPENEKRITEEVFSA